MAQTKYHSILFVIVDYVFFIVLCLVEILPFQFFLLPPLAELCLEVTFCFTLLCLASLSKSNFFSNGRPSPQGEGRKEEEGLHREGNSSKRRCSFKRRAVGEQRGGADLSSPPPSPSPPPAFLTFHASLPLLLTLKKGWMVEKDIPWGKGRMI